MEQTAPAQDRTDIVQEMCLMKIDEAATEGRQDKYVNIRKWMHHLRLNLILRGALRCGRGSL